MNWPSTSDLNSLAGASFRRNLNPSRETLPLTGKLPHKERSMEFIKLKNHYSLEETLDRLRAILTSKGGHYLDSL